MDIPQANFLTPSEFHRGPDLLRPGTLTGRNVDANAIAFIYTAFPYARDEIDIRVSEVNSHFIYWLAPIGHERVTDRESVLRALFGPDFRDAAKDAGYEQEIEIGKRIIYDPVELRRMAVAKNLFGRHGNVRGVSCLMIWNECENWQEKLNKILVLLAVPDDGLVTLGSALQWWVRDYKAVQQDQRE